MKKAIIRTLCLALALFLPLTALGEAQEQGWLEKALKENKQVVATLTAVPGAELAQDQMVADILEVAGLEFVLQGEDYLSLALLLSGETGLSVDLKADDEGFFVASAMLGADPLYFNWEDMQALAEKAAEGSAGSNQAFAVAYSSYYTQMLQAMNNKDGDATATPATQEEAIKALEDTLGKDYADWVRSVINRAEVTEGDFTAATHDPATEKTEFTLTKEDITTLMETEYFQNMMKQQMLASASQDTQKSATELDAEFAKLMDEAKSEIEKMTFVMPMTMLTHGEELISMTANMTATMPLEATGDNAATTSTVSMAMDYNRLTTGDTKTHTAQMAMNDDTEKLMSLEGILNVKDNQDFDFNLTVLADDEQDDAIVMTGHKLTADKTTEFSFRMAPGSSEEALVLQGDYVKGENAVDGKLEVYFGNEDALAAPLITLNLNVTTQEPDGRFAALEGATPTSSLQPAQMSESELSSFAEQVQGSFVQSLSSLISLLPPSLFQSAPAQ